MFNSYFRPNLFCLVRIAWCAPLFIQILLQYWGLDFRDQMNVARNYFGQYSTEVFTKKAQAIITKHNTLEVNI